MISRIRNRVSEKRPFFVEGSQLFSGRTDVFLFRRVGTDHVAPQTRLCRLSSNATILGAAKITDAHQGLSVESWAHDVAEQAHIYGSAAGDESSRSRPATDMELCACSTPPIVDGGDHTNRACARFDDKDPLAEILRKNVSAAILTCTLRWGV